MQKKRPSRTPPKSYEITLPYLESESRRFIHKLAKIIENKIDINVVPVYKSFKICRYLKLKWL